MSGDTEVEEWERHASAGSVSAMFNLGVHHNLAGDLETAIPWYIEAAHGGSHDAMLYLGRVSELRGDKEQAIRWTRNALNAGSPLATDRLRSLLAPEVPGSALAEVSRRSAEAAVSVGDLKQAETLWNVAADLGDTDSMICLGTLAAKRGNLGMARLQFERAAAAGSSAGATSAAQVARDRGVFQDEVNWHKKAVELGGGTQSMTHVALAYERIPDEDNAVRWYVMAADAGNTDAMFNLGLLHHRRGDYESSLAWFQRAAEAGELDGWVYMSKHFAGLGDRARQIDLLSRAAAGGHSAAIATLGFLGIEF